MSPLHCRRAAVALLLTLEPTPQAVAVCQPTQLCRYWTLEQMVSHHTLGGCNLRPGDLLGTGTLSCNVSPLLNCSVQ